jgi:CBS domain-containing protein
MGLKENLHSECVSNLPCREAILIPPETTVRQAAETMQAKKLGCAVVVDAEGKPIGIFTERTLIELLLQQIDNLGGIPVRDHLETEWFCAQSSDPISAVLDAVQKRGARFVCELDEQGKAIGLTGQKGLSEYIADHFPEQVMVQRIGGNPGTETREGA